MREAAYQAQLIRKLKRMLPGCLIVKNDSDYLQGILDLTVFYGRNWAMLEVKANSRARVQPNQEYYVDLCDDMSFAAFIYPENEEEVLDALQDSFGIRRKTRVSQR